MIRNILVGLVALLVTGAVVAENGERRNYSDGGTIHIAAIQLTVLPGGLEANLENVERLIREAAARGAKYILLPEHFPGQMNVEKGMSVEQVRAGAQVLDGLIARRMLGLSRDLAVYIAFPLGEKGKDGAVFNSIVYAGPDGIEGVHRKRVLVRIKDGDLPQERDVYAPGDTDGVIDWGGVRVGALICAEGGFPNFYEARLSRGVQLITHSSSSWGIKTDGRNPSPSVAARRYEVPVVFANRYRETLMHRGNTQICDAAGEIIAQVGVRPNVVIDAEIEIPPVR